MSGSILNRMNTLDGSAGEVQRRLNSLEDKITQHLENNSRDVDQDILKAIQQQQQSMLDAMKAMEDRMTKQIAAKTI